MKSLLAAAILLTTCFVQAQSYYQYNVFQGRYMTIGGPDVLIDDSATLNNNAAIIHTSYPNLGVLAFGAAMDSTIEIGSEGYIAAVADTSGFVFDPFFTDLRSVGNSELRMKKDRVGADSVLDIEWYKFAIAGHPDSDYITFKARIYLTSEIIEFTYGKSQISPNPSFGNTGPYLTLLYGENNLQRFHEQMWFSGDPNNPTFQTSIGTLDSFPSEGMVYRFVGRVTRTSLSELQNHVELSVYPNPAQDYMKVIGGKRMETISLTDLNGKEVLFVEPSDYQQEVPLTHLKAGHYILKVSFIDGSHGFRRFQVND